MKEVALRALPVLDDGSRPLGELRATEPLLELLEAAVNSSTGSVLVLSPVYDSTTKRLLAVLGVPMRVPTEHTTTCSRDNCPCYLAGQEAISDEIAEAQAQIQRAAIDAIRHVTNGKQVVVSVEDLAVALFTDGMEQTDATSRLRRAVDEAK